MCLGPLIKISGVTCQIVFVYIFAVIKTKSSITSISHITTSPPPAATITKYEKNFKKKKTLLDM